MAVYRRPEYLYSTERHGHSEAEYAVVRRTAEGSGGTEVVNYPFEDLAENVAAFLRRTEERCKIRLANHDAVGTTEPVFKEAEEF